MSKFPEQIYTIICTRPKQVHEQDGEFQLNVKNSSNTMDTHYSSIISEENILNEIRKNRQSPFKKIKQLYLNQKNNEGKILKQTIQSGESPVKFKVIQRLDDAITIFSENSPKSARSERFIFEQSVIIMSSENIEVPEVSPRKVELESTTSCSIYKKRNQYEKPKLKKLTESLILLDKQRSLYCLSKIGLLVYCEYHNNDSQAYQKYLSLNLQNTLKLYHFVDFSDKMEKKDTVCSKLKNKTLVLYEPYEELLTNLIIKQSSIEIKHFLRWMQKIAEAMKQLVQKGIFIVIDPSNVAMINRQIKIIVRPHEICGKQNQSVNSFGMYFSSHFKILINSLGGKEISKFQKIVGFNIFIHVEIKQLISQIMKNSGISFQKIINILQKMRRDF